jgi:DNA-binding response OmpR family regulator
MELQFGSGLDSVSGQQPAQHPEAVLLDLSTVDLGQAREAVEQCRKLKIPVVAVLSREALETYDPSLNPDELIIHPLSDSELLVRINQAIYRVKGPVGAQILKVGELSIDLERYDVTVAGRRVSLTYKEFQLLVLLASNPGRVYSRENLLSQVWGYDYLGGTRTVDVHVRRLRSKIEAPGRSFIETVYLVGYRFKVPG